ncbi:hypothetical protein EJ08DRAFT_484120 [Tothia fuscella]|uniref:Uncharacterized protein n=1 Tax=Tothia fuscella TaxID=1048955 RepID=A0A9P4NHQ0_9PEZI|nr:hypothetical protein EJ08DRAFT_484120 [Tothia fuscella]
MSWVSDASYNFFERYQKFHGYSHSHENPRQPFYSHCKLCHCGKTSQRIICPYCYTSIPHCYLRKSLLGFVGLRAVTTRFSTLLNSVHWCQSRTGFLASTYDHQRLPIMVGRSRCLFFSLVNHSSAPLLRTSAFGKSRSRYINCNVATRMFFLGCMVGSETTTLAWCTRLRSWAVAYLDFHWSRTARWDQCSKACVRNLLRAYSSREQLEGGYLT